MRKQVFGRKFKRDANERKALFNSLISGMIKKGRIETTEQKAKAIKPDLEKMVTKAKKGDSARRLLQADLAPYELERMVTVIGPGFKKRAGGYTRIIRKGKRFNDNASMVLMEWSEMEEVSLPVKPKSKPAAKRPTPTKKTIAKKTAAKKPARKTTRKAAK
jgi:large subunit ribosomal protein L17